MRGPAALLALLGAAGCYDFSALSKGTGGAGGATGGTGGRADAGGSGGTGGRPVDASPDAPAACDSQDEMISILGGAFTMGCNLNTDSQCDNDEKPPHAVTLNAYQIDRTEVTQGAYNRCVLAATCQAPCGDWDPVQRAALPVTCVDWDGARAYCGFVGKRLPSEAEWERAARGTDGRIYPWGDTAADCTRANIDGCGNVTRMPGGCPGASPVGAVDMAGNVSEWVADWYDGAYYASSPSASPTGPSTGTDRVIRGGSLIDFPVAVRSGFRNSRDPTGRYGYVGFRCAR